MAHPEYAPQLATLVRTPPSGPEWLHEIKYDGYRIGGIVRDGRATLVSRTGRDWTEAFPDVAAALAALPTRDAMLDGEVAAVLPDGRTSFQALQHARADATRPLVYFAFDLLRLEGESIGALPLEARKAKLRDLLGRGTSPHLRYADHVEGHGGAFFARACRMGLEGIISKQRHQPYRPGRHPGWTKTKCVRRQELVIGGYTDPEGTRAGLGALLVGWYDGDRLTFAGKVGTGFTQRGALELRQQLERLARTSSPFDPPPPRAIARAAHWVTPSLVCEVAFTEWTGDGMIRHPSFQGLRADKAPRDVRREDPVDPPGAAKRPPRQRARARLTKAGASVLGVVITHPDRVVYPDPGLTKLDLARYYERMADWIVPHVEGRPLTLVRCPGGLAGSCFYMKHVRVRTPAPLRHVEIAEKSGTGDYLVADTAAAVVGLVQMGVLEIHTWNAVTDDLERPDRLVFDLDPGEDVPWSRVVQAAQTVRRALEALDLASVPKTTGGRGVHVVVPLVPRASWAEGLDFARALSEAIERADPASYTTRFAKRARPGRILIDYLRNSRGSTSVAAYSSRARAGAPVSVPLSWQDLKPALDPGSLTVGTVPRRLANIGDPWKAVKAVRQSLTAPRLRAVHTLAP
jgi:bifunctional non-homologous end joining protein LigD